MNLLLSDDSVCTLLVYFISLQLVTLATVICIHNNYISVLLFVFYPCTTVICRHIAMCNDSVSLFVQLSLY